jgi:hypothetical protein
MNIFSNRNQGGIRRPAVAGAFYPSSSSSLREDIISYLANVEKIQIDGKIIALIVPHAGYMYSGQVASYAYKQIEGMTFDSAIALGVSHRVPFSGVNILNSGAYETPLGIVKIDEELATELMNKTDLFEVNLNADALEHSLEVQVPFLQVVLPEFRIVPILMRNWNNAIGQAISNAITTSIKEKNVLIVASTDMSHYHSYKEAVSMDDVALTSIRRMDIEQLQDDLMAGEAELCGAGAVLTTLMIAQSLGANGIKILKYANSGDVTGDKSDGVVGYFSAVIYKEN